MLLNGEEENEFLICTKRKNGFPREEERRIMTEEDLASFYVNFNL